MLVLERCPDQSVIITLEDGREIKVTLVEMRGYKVRLGFQAHPGIRIDRDEIHQRRQRGELPRRHDPDGGPRK